MRAVPFSKEQDEWIAEHHRPEKIIRELTAEFNEAWNQNRTVDVMKGHCRRLGLQQERRSYTAEQDKWLTENAPLLSVKETAILFNFVFKENRTAGSLKIRCNRNLRTFHENKKYGFGCPIGTETNHSGYVWVKVTNTPYRRDSFYKNWKPKHRIVWEKHNGPLPEGMTIVFLDRNKGNCSIENLYAVDGKVKREMVKKRWFSDNPELTLAAIKWCELFYSIKKVVNSE